MAEPWLATLAEVRRQAARVASLSGVQPPETDGTWYDVAAGSLENSDLETLDESGAWRGLQWLNAFEILVASQTMNLAISLVPIAALANAMSLNKCGCSVATSRSVCTMEFMTVHVAV